MNEPSDECQLMNDAVRQKIVVCVFFSRDAKLMSTIFLRPSVELLEENPSSAVRFFSSSLISIIAAASDVYVLRSSMDDGGHFSMWTTCFCFFVSLIRINKFSEGDVDGHLQPGEFC